MLVAHGRICRCGFPLPLHDPITHVIGRDRLELKREWVLQAHAYIPHPRTRTCAHPSSSLGSGWSRAFGPWPHPQGCCRRAASGGLTSPWPAPPFMISGHPRFPARGGIACCQSVSLQLSSLFAAFSSKQLHLLLRFPRRQHHFPSQLFTIRPIFESHGDVTTKRAAPNTRRAQIVHCVLLITRTALEDLESSIDPTHAEQDGISRPCAADGPRQSFKNTQWYVLRLDSYQPHLRRSPLGEPHPSSSC